MESPATFQVLRPLTSRAGYFNLAYLKDLVDRVEARELPLEEALEDGRNPLKPPPPRAKNAHNLGTSRGVIFFTLALQDSFVENFLP
jgi:hypothetical protein